MFSASAFCQSASGLLQEARRENLKLASLNVQEGGFVNGEWKRTRWLNGDQTHQGRHLRLEPGHFEIQRIKLYRYQ